MPGCQPDATFDIAACIDRARDCSFYPKIPYNLVELYCGSGYGHYDVSNVSAALTGWVIPLFGLLANMHFTDSTLDGLEWHRVYRTLNSRGFRGSWRIVKSQLPKYFECAEQPANPISTNWSLATKLYLRRQLQNCCNEHRLPGLGAQGRSKVATICDCFDEFGHEEFEDLVNRLVQLCKTESKLRTSGKVSQVVRDYVSKASRKLEVIRIRNTRRAAFAILVYIAEAISTLLASMASSGLDFSIPHTIALRVLCFLSFSQVILSSGLGAWSRQAVSQAIIQELASKIHEIEMSLDPNQADLWSYLAKEEIKLWDGGSYVFRPQKSTKMRPRDLDEFSCKYLSLQHCELLAIAFFMVIVAFAVSFIVSYLTPTRGIGGRALG